MSIKRKKPYALKSVRAITPIIEIPETIVHRLNLGYV